jgi:hypothetical protein
LRINFKEAVKKYLETIKDTEKAEELQNKINSFSFFDETFEDKWNYNWGGIYKSFFITSQGGAYKSYLTSTWNA